MGAKYIVVAAYVRKEKGVHYMQSHYSDVIMGAMAS